jgi:eukaryotic-like serine/threonine-protein kinase
MRTYPKHRLDYIGCPQVDVQSKRGEHADDAAIGPYRVLDVIGRGGMGVVHRAEHVQTGTLVALKRVVAVENLLLSALRSEIRTLARLQHPGVVRIIDEGLSAGTPWYAMELLEGETLSARLDHLWDRHPSADESTLIRGEPDSGIASMWELAPHLAVPEVRRSITRNRVSEAVQIVRKLCEALAYVHAQGIVHRDLKPSNIFLRADDRSPVLIDFGLVSRFQAASGRENLDDSGSARGGTPAYMAPEQLQHEQVDARADLYALGCLIFELLTGRLPPDRENVVYRQPLGSSGSPPRPSELIDGVPPDLDDLVAGLLASRPQDRIGYAADVIEALDAADLPGEVDRRSDRVPSPRRSYLYRPRLVGRASEIARLWPRLEAIRTGVRAALFIGGESGCGKTMLVNELARQATAAGVRVVAGECRPLAGESTLLDPRDAPLHPFRPLLRAVADSCRSGGVAVAARVLTSWGKLLALHEPALENVPGQAEKPESPLLSGEAARDRLLGALRDVLFAFAAERPVLLILDDLQWADELSLSFLRMLSGEVLGRTPLVVLGTFRSEELSPPLQAILDDPLAELVMLGRLDGSAVSSMVADMLGMIRAPRPLVEFLLGASEGNPFFVAEYLRAAAAEGILVREQRRWHLPGLREGTTSAYERIQLPRSIRGLVGRRLAGLSTDACTLASNAAILGRTGDLAVLADMRNASPEQLTESLAELVSRQVIDVVAGRYSFVHDKVRESAFEQLPEVERPAIHLRAAEALERLSADPDPFQLALHYRNAGRADKAYLYAYMAGRRALEAGAFLEARAHLQSALTIAETQSGALPEVATQEQAHLRRLLGEALVVSGELGQGIDHLRRACEDLGIPAPARTRSAWILMAMRELIRWALAAGPLARWSRITDDKRRALWTMGSDMNRLVSMANLFLVRPIECLGALFLSGRLAEEAGADGQRAAAYAFAASVCGMVGMRRLSVRLYAAARGLAAATKEVLPLLWQVSSEALFHHYLNADWEGLERCTAPALARADENHLIHDRHPVEFAVAMGELEQGKLAAGQIKFERIHTRALTFGHRQYVVSARGALLLCDLYAGRFLHIVESSESVINLHSDTQSVDLFIVLTCIATAKLRLGDSAGALDMAARACALFEAGAQLEGRPLAVRVLYDLGEVLIVLWREALAQHRPPGHLAKRAIAVHRRLARVARRRRHVQPCALLLEGRLFEVRGQSDKAAETLARARDAAAALHMSPFEAFARFDLGRQVALPDEQRRANVECATELFERMVYPWHLERARALGSQIAGLQRGRKLV